MKSSFFVKCTLFLVLVLGALGVTACGPNPLTPSVVAEQPTSFVVPITSAVAPFEARTIDGVAWTVPSGIDLDSFPLLGGVLTARDAKLLGLHKEVLKVDTIFYNELRTRHTFEAALAKAGVEVWVDRYGIVRYLASCGNRQEAMTMTERCPLSVSCPSGMFTNADGTHTQGAPPQPIMHETFRNVSATSQSVTDGKKATVSEEKLGWLGDFAKFLLHLIFILALTWLIAELLAAMVRRFRNMNPAPIAPIPPVTPVVPAPPAPVPAPPAPPALPVAPVVSQPPVAPTPTPARPVLVTMTRQYGPFKTIVVSDRQVDGFHVSGDGGEIGVFKTPGRTEDAGTLGHYFVVTDERRNNQ